MFIKCVKVCKIYLKIKEAHMNVNISLKQKFCIFIAFFHLLWLNKMAVLLNWWRKGSTHVLHKVVQTKNYIYDLTEEMELLMRNVISDIPWRLQQRTGEVCDREEREIQTGRGSSASMGGLQWGGEHEGPDTGSVTGETPLSLSLSLMCHLSVSHVLFLSLSLSWHIVGSTNIEKSIK